MTCVFSPWQLIAHFAYKKEYAKQKGSIGNHILLRYTQNQQCGAVAGAWNQ